MGVDLRPSKGAIGISRQERYRVSNVAFAPHEDAEGRALGRNNGPSLAVVADTLTSSEPGLSRRLPAGGKLKPGRYTVAVVATDAAGDQSPPQTASFTLTRR